MKKSQRADRRGKIVAMVPAKLGSTRLTMKNLALIKGKPLLYYPIKAAKDSGIFDSIVINAEDMEFSAIAKRYGVGFYKRPDSIVSSATKTDTVVYDFLKNCPCDIVAWVSPIAPLENGVEVREMVGYFLDNRLDTLMTVKEERAHCVYRGKPVNYREDEIFARTQDLEPVYSFVYAVMMWRREIFMREFERKGYALLSGKVGYYPVSKLSAIIVKKTEDLMMADFAMRGISGSGYKVRYDRIVTGSRLRKRS